MVLDIEFLMTIYESCTSTFSLLVKRNIFQNIIKKPPI